MKTNKIFIVFISIFLVLIVGCTNGIKNEGNKIVVEKRVSKVSESDKYEYYNEVKDNNEVQNIKDILNSISWENIKVDMVSPPHYKFHFEDTTEKQELNGLIYDLWISPDEGRIELVIDSKSKYVHLDKAKSAELFKLITGKKLDEV
ncbi:hypothetical protein [Clostridium sp.]|uniref:hypothetical protein n=1 Tax=Clostridium sp. TaxID=1506 RepID=UPI003EECB9F0